MFFAEVQRFKWVRGTIFGFEVVPEVWRIKAVSSGKILSLWFITLGIFFSLDVKLNFPEWSLLLTMRLNILIPLFFATSTTGEFDYSFTISAFGFKSSR